MRVRDVLVCALVASLAPSCSEPETTLVIELVPNPEVNTRANVAEHVNSIEFLFEAQGGFAGLDAADGDTWGQYLVTDLDADGVLDLVLTRGAQAGLDPFAVTQGSQGGRVIEVSARGFSEVEGEVAAIGSPTAAVFETSQETQVEVPFNLVPAFLPLRVSSMTPAQSSQVPPTVTEVVLQLSGNVRVDALEHEVELRSESFDEPLDADLTTSYVDTGMGRLTNVRLVGCTLTSGRYTVTLSTAIQSTTGQFLDQQLGLEGRQPFQGEFTVSGEPEPPLCDTVGILAGGVCPDPPCQDGYECDDGVCVLSIEAVPEGFPEGGPTCDAETCGPPDEFVCHPVEGCVPSCLPYGICLDPTETCDATTGLCG